MPVLPLTPVFDEPPGPRRGAANEPHALTDVLTAATCAAIGGAASREAIAEYGRTEEAFLRRSLPLGSGIPRAGTFERVFAKLAPGAFARAFGRWVAAACGAAGLVPIAIGGASARRAKENAATGCLAAVRAWATGNRLTLGRVAVPGGSSEVGVIPELRGTPGPAGAIGTIGAAGCQVENAAIIRGRGGHYLLAVRGNRPTLRAAAERVAEAACEADLIGVGGAEGADDARGRHEGRYAGASGKPAGLPADWPGVAAAVQVNRGRGVGGERTWTSHGYLTRYAGTAAEVGAFVRGHWGLEGGLHWVLGVVFRGDDSRVRAGHAGENLAMVRRVAVALLRRAPGKGSTPTTRLKAGRDDDYLPTTGSARNPCTRSAVALEPVMHFGVRVGAGAR